jgi:hypothetical protein
LVLLASSLPLKLMMSCIQEIQRQHPVPASLAILETHHHCQHVLECGASGVLLNGFSVQELFDKIDYLQARQKTPGSNALHAPDPGW